MNPKKPHDNLQDNASNPAPVLIGLDRGDHEIHAAILAPQTATPELQSFQSGAETLHGFITRCQERFRGHPLHIAFEQPAPGLLHALMDWPGLELYPMNPSQTARFREVLCSSRKKDDPSDAAVILELLRTHLAHFPRWQPESENMRLLRLLVEGRRKAVDARTQDVLALISLLKNYYPQALELCDCEHLDRALALDFLRRWPTLQALQKARPQTLRTFFYQHNSRSETLIRKRLDRIAIAIPLSGDAPLLEASVLRLEHLIAQIAAANRHIGAYEKRIAQVLATQPQSAVLSSFPGAGPTLGARLCAAFGTRKENLPKAQNMACLARRRPHPQTLRQKHLHPAPPGPAALPPSELCRIRLSAACAFAPGRRPSTNSKKARVKAAGKRCARWPSNGSASCTAAGPAAPFTTTPNTPLNSASAPPRSSPSWIKSSPSNPPNPRRE